MKIVDIITPASPSIVASFPTEHRARYVVVRDTICYLLDDRRLSIVNITSPSNPQELGHMDLVSIRAEGLDVKNGFAYEIGDYGEFEFLYTIDVSNPSNPRLTCTTGEEWACSNLYAFENNLFLANSGYGVLRSFSISRPDTLVRLGSIQITGITNVRAGMGYLFGSLEEGAVAVINISRPDSCREILRYDTPGLSNDIYVSGDYIYIADSSSIQILRITPSSTSGDKLMPLDFALSQNYPNPFNASTTIKYYLGKTTDVNITIYDILGRKIESIHQGMQVAGEHQAVWNAGSKVSGIYFYKISANGLTQTRRMLLLK
jgi:hypothetical protein